MMGCEGHLESSGAIVEGQIVQMGISDLVFQITTEMGGKFIAHSHAKSKVEVIEARLIGIIVPGRRCFSEFQL